MTHNWSVLVNGPCALDKNMYLVVIGQCSINIKLIISCSSLPFPYRFSVSFFYYWERSIEIPIIVSVSPYNSVSLCIIYFNPVHKHLKMVYPCPFTFIKWYSVSVNIPCSEIYFVKYDYSYPSFLLTSIWYNF